MYDIEQVAVSTVAPAVSVQLPLAGVNVPVVFVVKLTVPVGVAGDEDVSVTVAVQLVEVPVSTVEGEHWTVVVVE